MKKHLKLCVSVIAALSMILSASCTDTAKKDSATPTQAAATSTEKVETATEAAKEVNYSDPAYISKEVIQPSFFVLAENYTGKEIVFETIKKYTNIDFQLITVALANYNEKLSTTIASGEIPDLMGLRTAATANKYGPQGAFLAFNPYMEKGMMPNFINVLESKPPAMILATSSDNKNYSAPRIYETPRMDQALIGRLDILEKLGLSREPETFDDFYNILAKVKEAYPKSYPYFNRWETSHLITGFAKFTNSSYTFFYDYEADQYSFGPEKQGYKDALIFMNKLYKDNLLAKDYATASTEEYYEKMITNSGFFTYDYQDTKPYEESKQLLDEGWNWGALLPPKYNGVRAGYPVLEGYYGYVKVIGAKTKYPEEMIKFIDWTYSTEGQDALMFGIKGETYEVASDGKINMKADIKYEGNPTGTINIHGLNNQNIFSVLSAEGSEFYENVGQFVIAQKQYLSEKNAFGKPSISAVFRDEAKQKQYSDARVQLETYILEQSAKVIQGELSIDEWDKVIETCKKTYKSDEALALIQEAFNQTMGR